MARPFAQLPFAQPEHFASGAGEAGAKGVAGIRPQIDPGGR